MSNKLKYLPNSITFLRIVGTMCLLFTKPLSTTFFVVYVITGITDVLDGFFARKLKLTSNFGAKLDSIADLLFYSFMIISIMPILFEKISVYIWIGVAVAVTFRLASYITAAIKFKKFASIHSYFNKITGFFVFSVPFILLLDFAEVLCWIVCFVGMLSSLYEFIYHLKSNMYKVKNVSN